MATKLYPCPTCGHDLDVSAIRAYQTSTPLWNVECVLCGYMSPMCPHEQVAIAYHNDASRRASAVRVTKVMAPEPTPSRVFWSSFAAFSLVGLLLFCLLLFVGCAHAPPEPARIVPRAEWKVTKKGHMQLPASLPVRILDPPGLGPMVRKTLHLAAAYWNCVLGTWMFSLDETHEDEVLIIPYESDWLGKTYRDGAAFKTKRVLGLFQPIYSGDNNGELVGGNVTVDIEYLHHDTHRTETVWRHELGHVIGLGHTQNDSAALMHRSVHRDLYDALDATEIEIDLIRFMLGLDPPSYPTDACQGVHLEHHLLLHPRASEKRGSI